MAIKRREYPGGWTEEADNPKDARELHEKHGPAIQKRGIEKFQENYKKDLSEGFERITDPNGNATFVRRDRMQAAIDQGYGKAPTRSAFVVPEMPWHKSRKPVMGRRVWKMRNGELVEEP